MEHNEDLRERMCSETCDLISRNRLIDDLIIVEAVMKANGDKAAANAVAMVTRKVENAPAIAPESLRPKGRWEEEDCGAVYACNQCGYLTAYNFSHYCANCGAKMEG